MRPSKARRLGRTDLQVTVLGFGGTAIGNLFRPISDNDAREVLTAVWEAGVRYFDTAPLYGLSLSESRLGDFLTTHARNDFVVSTKVGRMLEPATAEQRVSRAIYPDVPALRPRFDYSRDAILRSYEYSLKRLKVDYVDLLYVHDLAAMNHASTEEYERHYKSFFQSGGYEALLNLKREGHVRALGIGVGSWEAAERLCTDGEFDVCLLAGRYTLLEQTALKTFLPLCVRRDISVIIGGPYNSGILATGAVKGAKYNYKPAPQEILDRVQAIERVCAAHNVPLAAAALQFPLHHPAVAGVIPGIGTTRELDDAVAALIRHVPIALYEDLRAEGLISKDAPTGNLL